MWASVALCSRLWPCGVTGSCGITGSCGVKYAVVMRTGPGPGPGLGGRAGRQGSEVK